MSSKVILRSNIKLKHKDLDENYESKLLTQFKRKIK